MKKIANDKRDAIDTLIDGFVQSYIVSMTARDDTLMHDLLIHIQKKYHLTRLPYHIECVDISHFQGDWMSAGLSALQGGLPTKKHYRHYKVQLFADNKAGTSNDYLALQEIIVRRFGLKKSHIYTDIDTSGFPDVFVIDGGVGQLGIIRELCQIFPVLIDIIRHKTTFVSLGKGAARTAKGKNAGAIEYIYTFIDHNPTQDIQKIPLIYDQGDRLLTGLRDEAHRFANKYRTMQMKKETSM